MKTKNESFVVGQTVWIEMYGGWSLDNHRTVDKYEIVELNKTSAYAVKVERLAKYHEDPKKHSYMRIRISQKKHIVESSGTGYYFRLWPTKKAFEKNVTYNNERKVLLKKAEDHIKKLNILQLKKVLEL